MALGDSYTIGEGVNEQERWPNILVENLNKQRIKVALLPNPSKTGYTTQNLIQYELPLFETLQPDFVTILIGVNDWVQGLPSDMYSNNLDIILDRVQNNLKNKQNIVLITIPDFSATPTGKLYANGRDISKGIQEYNNIIKAKAQQRKLLVADIFTLSQNMKNDSSLINNDGLHPSGKEYMLWEKIIRIQVNKIILNK